MSSTGAIWPLAGGFAAAEGASSAARRPHALRLVRAMTVAKVSVKIRVIGNPEI